ncbi:biotin transporter BioY [Mycetocola spongiae]|uniref:biotin transporter BioY n=1 Tax=Mycetocola spongiae TaxID=2859226 RepID=UPI001CF4F5A9|nr:biotin transporter BioY [Mycetocola spongiae]UCR88501.1 biotin transporter BioY [Mycetocola spongiae]
MSGYEKSPMRDIARISTFAALIAVLGVAGQIPLFGGAVPVTFQTLGVMLAGAILGWWRGMAAVLLLLVLALAGLPLLAGGKGGAGVFVGPTVGYLVGWIFGVAVVGLIVQAGARTLRWWRVALGAVIGGIGVIYLFGIPGLSLISGMSLADAARTNLIFVPGDLLKAVLAVLLSMALWRAYPAAFTFTRRRRAEVRA